jgi:MOSC domain-containing protein YiiM
MSATLSSVRTGRVAPLGPDGVPSGFVKQEVDGPVAVTPLGLDGDQQADLTVHGGPEKAVYGYAGSHYALWRAEQPQHAARMIEGAMGENLTIAGLEESGICVGDVHAIGTALLQVCQPRQPCFKMALRFEDRRLPKAFVKSGRAGWYYRVLRPGSIARGDIVTLQDRPHPDFAFTRLIQIIYHGRITGEELARMAVMEGLASQWRDIARVQLQARAE